MSSIKIEKILDLKEIFKKLEIKNYTIIKLPEIFPNYDIGSDLDIFCYDVQDMSKTILANIQKYISKDIKIEITDKTTQIYIDIIKENKVHFRFDLYGALPRYKNISIKEAFFSSIIENAKDKKIDEVTIKIPCDIDENILRYIEYQEWYAGRPDKIKHIEYIEKQIELKNIDLNQILNKLHYYTTLPNSYEDRQVTSSVFIKYVQYLYYNIRKVFIYLKDNGIKKTVLKIKDQLI